MPSKTDPILYTPSGRAGEYADHGYALNLYKGCPHGCRYCYVPCNRFVKLEDIPAAREKFHASITPVPYALERLQSDLDRLGKLDEPIFLSFNGDPYPTDSSFRHSITREAFEIIGASGNRRRILTKGYIPSEDLNLLGPGDEVGVTLTLHSDQDHILWEPETIDYGRRIFNLQRAKNRNIKTWVSFEPPIDVSQTFQLIELCSPYADVIKIGKANHLNKWNWPSEEWRRRVESIDWTKFTKDVVRLLQDIGKPFVLKEDLLRHLPQLSYEGECYYHRPPEMRPEAGK